MTTGGVLEKLPPHDTEAEEAVIASLMVDDDAIWKVRGLLEPDDFFREKCGWIYAACLALAKRREPCSPILLANELANAGKLEAVGGVAYLSQLTTDLPTAVGVEYYARLVSRAASYRRLIGAGSKIVQEAYAGGLDPEIAAANAFALIRNAVGAQATGDVEPASAILEREWGDIFAELHEPAAHRGIDTGWPSLNRLLYSGGLMRGSLYVWAAQTSIGKSTVGRTLLRNMALGGNEILFFTLEQNKAVTVRQILYGMAQIDAQRIAVTGKPVEEAEWDRLLLAKDRFTAHLHRLHIDETAQLTPSQVRLRVAKRAAEVDLGVVCIDYLHRMKPDRERENEVRQLSEIVKELCAIAKEYNVALILFAQFNREGLKKDRAADEYRPHMGETLGAGDIDRLVFAQIALHRRQWYVERMGLSPKPGTENDLEVIMLKQQIGPAGVHTTLEFDGPHSTVNERRYGYEEERG